MSNVVMYGIPNCDQIKKARSWLESRNIHYQFHDFKKSGVTKELILAWLRNVSWEDLVNRKGTTWRGLDDARKASITDASSAAALMLESPSVIKRPVLVNGTNTHVGFSDELYQQIFKK